MCRRRPWRPGLLAGLSALAVLAPALAASGSPGGNAGDEPLVVVGHLPEPTPKSERLYAGHIAAVDADARRMYYLYTDPDGMVHVVTYDLRPDIPQPVGSGVLGPNTLAPAEASPYQTAVDTRRNRLLVLGLNLEAADQVATTTTSNLLVYDVRRNQRLSTWYPDKLVPGYTPFGITYSAADDRIYLIGEMSASILVTASAPTFGSKAIGPGTAVVALDAGTGKVEWIRPMPECQEALYSLNIGGLIARSKQRDALYVACTTGGTAIGQPYPGEAGVVRLTIDPGATSTADALRFPLEFFPVSGLYFNGAATGVATFDSRSDRLFLQSLAPKTPGAWVFDGRLSGWVGFVPAPDYSDNVTGYNEGLGRLYIGLNRIKGDPNNGIVVADGRTLPVQAGQFQRLTSSAFISTDNKSDRLFVLPEGASSTLEPYLVVRDRSRSIAPQEPLDYDALTDGVSEDDAAFISYSADVNAYGADVVTVGGLSAPFTLSGAFQIAPPAGGGTRGLMLARIGGLGLRPAGASASARSVTADLNTTQDWETNASLKQWPYQTVSCLDSGGGIKPQRSDVRGSHALVRCDLAGATSHGEADAAGLKVAGLSVARATSNADTIRNLEDGATTNVAATATGITVDIPGVGQLRVGHVAGRLATTAHGAAGTAEATYHRSIRHIELVDGAGKTVFGPATCETTVEARAGKPADVTDGCAAIAATVNRLTQTRMRLAFPMPSTVATPKGAYAAVEQHDSDYYSEKTGNDQGVVYPQDSTALRPTPAMQIVAYNDVSERSRLVAQFAGVQGDSIFNTTAEGDAPPPPPGDDANGSAQPDPGNAPPASQVDGSVPAVPTALPPADGLPPAVAQPMSDVAGWLFLRRSLRDALLVAGILAIAVGAGLLAFRRHELLAAMTVTPGGPST